MKLVGKVAIVTGAASGIGKAIAVRFAQEGSDIIIADIKPETSATVIEEIEKNGRRALFLKTDTAVKQDVEKIIAESVKNFGKIDILVNNAAIPNLSSLVEEEEEDWERIMSVNLKGYFLCAQAVAKQMIKQGSGGRIINIASDSGRLANMGVGIAYSVSKAGVAHLTRFMAAELGPYGINVNTVAPYATWTPMLVSAFGEQRAKEWEKEYAPKSPLGRIGQPEDQAGPCVFFASEDSSFVTGQILYLGGAFMPC